MSPTTTSSAAVTQRVAVRLPAIPWDAISAWLVSFGLVLYLALRGGGYDAVIRDQVGILVWWVVLLLAVVGLIPRLTRGGWVVLGLLAAWAAWTAIGIPTSESAERTLAEVGRLSAYVGVLLLALTMQGRAGSRHVLNGVACAIGLVTALAVLSRLHPQWFPANDQLKFLHGAARRLSYPLNYWNGLAGFMAMGAVLLLGVAGTARTRLGQGLAAAAVPLAGLGVYFCVSRGGAIVLVAGLVVWFVLVNDRLANAATLLVTGGGAAILIEAASKRPAVQTGVDTALGRSQGTEMIWLCVIVCAGVGLLQVAIGLAARHAERPRLLVVPRRVGAVIAAGIVVLGLAAFFGTSIHHDVAHAWSNFKKPPSSAGVRGGDVFSRLQDSAGQGRYQYWQQAAKAYHHEPLHGIGGGTFQFWWARHATVDGSVTDAHSLYAQTLAELGLGGIIILGLFVVLTTLGGAVRALTETGTARALLAAATGALVVFWLDASVEWIWQIAAVPAALFFLIAVVAGRRSPVTRPARMPVRVLAVVAAIAAFYPIAVGLSTVQQVRESQSAAREGRLVDAMTAARRADHLPGTSTTAIMQEALVLEQAGALHPALDAVLRATANEPTNWETWLVRSRLEARVGRLDAALADFRRARSLDPLSPLFH